ncbi:MAG: hypothetical protein Q8O03_08685 [Nanoarchaeota archaeon]|nr:hypothetical protein [Nanoarchaeota archaeon]
MATDLRQTLAFFEEYGFYDVVFPFILVFTIVFATLQKIRIFGEHSRRYNTIIAFVIALMFIAATKLVDALNQYLPVVGLVLALFLGLMLILGIFGIKEGSGVQKLGWILGGFVVLVVGASYLPKMGDIFGFLKPLKEYTPLIIMGAIVLGIVLWVSKEGGSKPSSLPKT